MPTKLVDSNMQEQLVRAQVPLELATAALQATSNSGVAAALQWIEQQASLSPHPQAKPEAPMPQRHGGLAPLAPPAPGGGGNHARPPPSQRPTTGGRTLQVRAAQGHSPTPPVSSSPSPPVRPPPPSLQPASQRASV